MTDCTAAEVKRKKKVLKEAKILVTLSLSTLGHFPPTWHAFEGSTLPTSALQDLYISLW